MKHRFARGAAFVAAAVGVVGLGVLYEAAEHGGELVYGYAGGVGIRTGDPADVNRLLIAGTYHQATQDRQAGRGDASTALVEATARRFPDNLELQLFSVDWQTEVKKDPAGAVQRLDALPIAAAEPRLRVRAGMLRANALAAQGNVAAAKAVLQTLKAENPTNQQIQRRLDELSR
jgi:predicted Zn-dependent protease